MAVMMPREKWTDERLDDLNKKVDDGFADTKAEMRAGFARVDGEIKELQREMNTQFNKVDARFDSINERFEALNRTLIGGLFVVVAAIVGSNVF
jgi:tetrahydromethanopterin S-methyltransferase subunit G